MNLTEKHLIVALTLSALFIVLNIIAVTQSEATNYFSQIEQFISRFLPG